MGALQILNFVATFLYVTFVYTQPHSAAFCGAQLEFGDRNLPRTCESATSNSILPGIKSHGQFLGPVDGYGNHKFTHPRDILMAMLRETVTVREQQQQSKGKTNESATTNISSIMRIACTCTSKPRSGLHNKQMQCKL